jgi:hypothetical protein
MHSTITTAPSLEAVDDWSDARLVAAVGRIISVPREAPADSFVLHAPLELLARAELLRRVRPKGRARARERLVGLASMYEAAGPAVAAPRIIDDAPVDALADALVTALERGELDDVDRLANALGDQATPLQLRQLLGGVVVSSLAAAGHASILLSLLPRVHTSSRVTGRLLRGPARELARYPGWRLRWFEDASDDIVGSSLAGALLDVPVLGSPGSDFILPVMSQAEASGVAPRLLSGVLAVDIDVARARRQLSRVAAWSMLHESPEHAPYGWSHCLTMPQAVMDLAGDGTDPRVAVAVAGTYVVGFRAALGTGHLVDAYAPEPPATTDLAEAIASGPAVAAAVAWHNPEATLDEVVAELATVASLHHDAHLVKYTLACFDAADSDPEQRRLYLAAAASLSGWWAQQPDDGFFD